MKENGRSDEGSILCDDFAWVRATLFPRWRRGTEWSVTYGTRSDETHEDGYCDTDGRVIYVHPKQSQSEADTRRLVLVHEVCHAVAGSGHGRKFCKRMRRAARDADGAGERELGTLLESEAVQHESSLPRR